MDKTNAMTQVSGPRLMEHIRALGARGLDAEGRRSRLAASDADKAGRDLVSSWFKELGLEVQVDRVGNLFGFWTPEGTEGKDPLVLGSHIDSVVDAGMYDGCYGVLSALEVVTVLKEGGYLPKRPLVVGAFTNEEGVRYQPDMMGSLTFVGDIGLEEVLATVGVDGTVLGEELARTGYAGDKEPGFFKPHAYIELHVEQGPILDAQGISIGAVENLQGISWQQVTIEGVANHAGTTPTDMRQDAGLAAARVNTFLRDIALASGGKTVATVGSIAFEPDVINVIPSRVVFTVDLRNPNEEELLAAEAALDQYLEELAVAEKVTVEKKRLARFEPVTFDPGLVTRIQETAQAMGLSNRLMTSGAGHDAQMMARICPTAMIFVPSVGGISHNPDEFTQEADLIAGANVLLGVVKGLV